MSSASSLITGFHRIDLVCFIFAIEIAVSTDVTAYDINTVANKVHSFNRPGKKVEARNICSITASQMDNIAADLWTMSPPCQPFTRIGLKKDLEDKRTDCLVHLMQNVLAHMKRPPGRFFLENVKGFETSEACSMVKDVLGNLGYHIRQFILSPSQFGIPNSRSRYYLIAWKPKMPDLRSNCHLESTIITEPMTDLPWMCPSCKDLLATKANAKVSDFLESNVPKSFYLPLDVLAKYIRVMDIVTGSSRNSCCFTSGYTRMYQATGSIIQMNESIEVKGIDEMDECFLNELQLRFFTPREVANLMSFPSQFAFPGGVSLRQMYKLLGNSVNVHVIAWIIWFLLMESS